jgi:hypothetical protein
MVLLVMVNSRPAHQVKSRATSQITAQQARAADGLGTVASALRRAGDELRPQNESLASYADMAVGELEHLSRRIRDKQPAEYLADVEDFARRRPAAFVGGSFLVGLALARFLKSTQPTEPRHQSDGPNQQGTFAGRHGGRPRESWDATTPPGFDRTPRTIDDLATADPGVPDVSTRRSPGADDFTAPATTSEEWAREGGRRDPQ